MYGDLPEEGGDDGQCKQPGSDISGSKRNTHCRSDGSDHRHALKVATFNMVGRCGWNPQVIANLLKCSLSPWTKERARVTWTWRTASMNRDDDEALLSDHCHRCLHVFDRRQGGSIGAVDYKEYFATIPEVGGEVVEELCVHDVTAWAFVQLERLWPWPSSISDSDFSTIRGGRYGKVPRVKHYVR
jgi:hypothetical protein